MAIPEYPERLWFASGWVHVSLWPLVKDRDSFGLLISSKDQACSCKIPKSSQKLHAFFLDLRSADLQSPADEISTANFKEGAILEINGHGQDDSTQGKRVQFERFYPHLLRDVGGDPHSFFYDAKPCPFPIWKITSKLDYNFWVSLCDEVKQLKLVESTFRVGSDDFDSGADFKLQAIDHAVWRDEIMGKTSDSSFMIHPLNVNLKGNGSEEIYERRVIWIAVKEGQKGELEQVSGHQVALWIESWNRSKRFPQANNQEKAGLWQGELYLRGADATVDGGVGYPFRLTFSKGPRGLTQVLEENAGYEFKEDQIIPIIYGDENPYLLPASTKWHL